jgi:hypothetical protein
VKVSARSLVSCSMTTVVGEAVLRSVCSVVRVAYGFSSMRGAAAACVAAEAAAGVLMMVFFAQNARELAESLTPIGGVVLRVMVSSACVAYGGVTSSLECPAVCVPAETASLAEVLAFGDLFDDLGSDRSSRKLSSGRVCCPVGRVVRQVGGLRQSPRQSRGSCGTRTSGQAGDPMVPHHRFCHLPPFPPQLPCPSLTTCLPTLSPRSQERDRHRRQFRRGHAHGGSFPDDLLGTLLQRAVLFGLHDGRRRSTYPRRRAGGAFAFSHSGARVSSDGQYF